MDKRMNYPDEMIDEMFGDYFMCQDCEYYHGVNTCDAYPDQIPYEILCGEVNHYLPYKNDKGIQFKKKKENV